MSLQATADNKGSAPKSYARRDHLAGIEKRVQKKWEDLRVYEADIDIGREKYLITFPYPYMNGRLHLGHAFSMTKAEFTARFQRLLGKNVLFPFAFHCTGMPIQAAANKLAEEIAKYGNPPIFPTEVTEDSEEAEKPGNSEFKDAAQSIAAKSKGKKTKLAVKGQGGAMRQWTILAMMVPQDEIASFTDPLKWLNYFPPLGISDLKAFGSAIDWRRSFITTSVNPFYDAFIRWQFNRLYKGGRIKSGFRPNVFSAKDRQVCADHDRASGEGAVPQEYTIIKLEVLRPFPAESPLNSHLLDGKKVYLAPATLRPETMYGQTNCYVLPEGQYGAFEFKNDEVFIVSERAALGLAHQDLALEWGQVKCLLVLTGNDLLGLPLHAPNSIYERVYTLPLLTISMGKGTGVVTSVPSDAPDDYIALKELKDKPLWREKFGLSAEMVEPYEVIPIIDIPGYGNMSAVVMCERLDIKSSKDSEKLQEAKDEVYLKGFYEGIMLVGECAGMKVCDAKPIVRKNLIDRGLALPYFEPDKKVVSRSGDECIVALTDQWYLSYGDSEWEKKVVDHLHDKNNFNGYNSSVMESFDLAVGWLKEWACSREFGLGTQLPWDKKWVIDSLSDSTIYMAYYTIAHLIHGGEGNLAGVAQSLLKPEDFTDEVFDFIFLRQPLPNTAGSSLSVETLDRLRREFEYWYPMDLRVSAKDLIPNHLTMCLYNHIEIWKERPEMWPRGIYCNGHIMVDAEKMSKSKGNFLMLLQCVEEYSADATRFALADAGDSLEDANFDRSVANQAVTYLFCEEEWIRSVILDAKGGRLRVTEDLLFLDRVFENEIDYLIEATHAEFSKMCFREGIHRCWFDMLIIRDLYRDWAVRCGIPMHSGIVLRFVEVLAVMMQPICPHWSEHVWELLGKEGSVCNTHWPIYQPYRRTLRKEYIFFRDFVKSIRLASIKLKVASPKHANIFLATVYEPKKIEVLLYLQSAIQVDGKFPVDIIKQLKSFVESRADLKNDTKTLMQFGSFMKEEAVERGVDALAIELPFNQKAIIEETSNYLMKVLDLAGIKIHNVEDGEIAGEKKKMESAVPGKPSFTFYTAK